VTFEQFQRSRRFVADLATVTTEAGRAPGFVYTENDYWIAISAELGQFETGSTETYYSLDAAERELYDGLVDAEQL